MLEFEQLLKDSIAAGTCLSVVLSKPRLKTDAAKITIRPLMIQAERQYQFSLRSGKQETHENYSADVALKKILELWNHSYAHAHLYTAEADWSARTNKRGEVSLSKSKPTKQAECITHNRVKHYLIPEDTPCDFLHAIGVMTATGKVKASHYRKFRQINRFLELVDDIVCDLPTSGVLHVVDFGCGKSYLTFALHHLLTVIHQREVQITGLDRNPDVIQQCQQICENLNCTGLEFQVGDITAYQAESPVDLSVSLHACDTATDDALAKAVGWNARVILAVPCCQHEIAGKLNCVGHTLLTKQGILKERFAALATDALRVQALEICGYKTQIVEFIDMEHTAKNLLIRAVRRSVQIDAAALEVDYAQFKAMLGLKETALDQLLLDNSDFSSAS